MTKLGLEIAPTESWSRERPGTILRQKPAPGKKRVEGSRLSVIVAKVFPTVPDVVGLRRRQAIRALRDVEDIGYPVSVSRVPSSSPEGMVIFQSPPGGTKARPDRQEVHIVVAKSLCTPGYHRASPRPDVDCYPGTGGGPRYEGRGGVPLGPFQVTGDDPYDLDEGANPGSDAKPDRHT